MVIFKHKRFEDDDFLLKHGAISEQAKHACHHLQGPQIPIYLFSSQSSLDCGAKEWLLSALDKQSLLDSLLLAQWEDRAWKGLFNYDVTTCDTKVTDGRRKFIVQLNEELVTNDFPLLKETVVHQGLDPSKFSIMIAQTEELLFYVKEGAKSLPEFIQATKVPSNASMSIIINANPIEYGHVFLLPSGFGNLSEFLDARLLEMVVRVAVEISNCSFCVFYDFSPSGSNHLRFQACYVAIPLPVERMPLIAVSGIWQEREIHIFEVTDSPIKALSFKSCGNLKLLVEVVAEICSCLQDQNIPYSLLINELGTKMFLFPQLEALEDVCSLSGLECGGYFVFKTKDEFDQVTEAALLKCVAAVSLGDKDFLAVKQLCCSIADKLCSEI